MDANEFWCRAFLAAMHGTYAQEGSWDNHGGPAVYHEKAADAALAVAQRRGMVTGERPGAQSDLERVEFTSRKLPGGMWDLCIGRRSVRVPSGIESFGAGGDTYRIKWGESMPPQPIEMWIERPNGGAR